MSWRWGRRVKQSGKPTVGTHGAVKDSADLPENWFGTQPKEQPGSVAAGRGNWIYRLGSAACYLQCYHREWKSKCSKAEGDFQGAALLLGRILTITGEKKNRTLAVKDCFRLMAETSPWLHYLALYASDSYG